MSWDKMYYILNHKISKHRKYKISTDSQQHIWIMFAYIDVIVYCDCIHWNIFKHSKCSQLQNTSCSKQPTLTVFLYYRTSRHVTTRHVTSWHGTSRHVVHVTSRHVTARRARHVTSRHVTPRHVTHVTSRHVTSCTSCTSRHARHVTSHHARHVTSRHVTSRHVTSRHVTTPWSANDVIRWRRKGLTYCCSNYYVVGFILD